MGDQAASDLTSIASTLSAANAAAVFPTTGVLAAGADDVSAAIAAMFGSHAQAQFIGNGGTGGSGGPPGNAPAKTGTGRTGGTGGSLSGIPGAHG